jgi:hypothetical protein
VAKARRYYLDTTAHIERWMGDRATKGVVREKLKDRKHSTSSHALREWKHIVDRSAAEVLNLEGQAGGLSSVLARLSQGRGRRAGQRLRVLSLLTAGANQLGPDLPIRARALLRYQSKSYFNHLIDDVRDGSECGLAAKTVRRGTGGRLELQDTCVKTDDEICSQFGFLNSKKGELERVGAALTASGTVGDRRLGKLALAAAQNPRDGKGKNCYAGLGDVCIALECGAKETLLTTDSVFTLMGNVLGFSVCRFNATPGA